MMLWLRPIFMATLFRELLAVGASCPFIPHYRDAAAALVGSLGLVPSINAGDNFVMGEP